MKRRTLLAGAALSAPVAWASGSVNQLRWLSDERIDIGRVALILAQEFRPALDVEAYSKQLDALVTAVRSKLDGATDPVKRTLAMRDVLFRENGFQYDHHPLARENQRNYLLDGILDTKKGICVTMPLLYVAVGQRLGYPVHIVCVPDHLFVRYVHRDFPELNIETTSGGKYFSDADYIRRNGVTSIGLRSGCYMRPLSYREQLGLLMTANAFVYAMSDTPKCLEYLKASLLLTPRRAETYEQISAIHQAYAKVTKGEESSRHAEASKAMMRKAFELGYVAIENVRNAGGIRAE
ncbi:transglutaminase family protein [Variovorax sp. KK3]|uniref:transglutaminase family protein n=1 Tax=Variovorax sp. KK3 TaxID=1855728 RepID=UPI0009FAEAD2|nr:transglutaminase family protein [Variovorax sp. KK3]